MDKVHCLNCGETNHVKLVEGAAASANSNYGDNKEYLNDLLLFIDLLRSKVLEKPEKKDPPIIEDREWERSSLLAMYLEIRADGLAAFRRGARLGFEKVIRKNKLTEIEAQILLILAFAAVQGDYGNYRDDDLNKVKNIGKMIQFLNKLDPVTAMSHWRKDSRLFEKKLIESIYPYRGKQVVPEALYLEAATLDQILGKKAFKRNGPAAPFLPSALSDKLGEYVVGQEHARRAVATGVFKHLQICELNKKRKGMDRLQKANLFLIGATGTGKTHLCRTLAQVLNVPFVICDATQYTETGYVGACVEEMLVSLSAKRGAKQEASQGGIIFIDEIDKIASRDVGLSHNSTRDVSGLSVQNELLKLLDGDIVHYNNVDYDVGKILFIVGGAFAGLEEIIAERLKHRQMGFLNKQSKAADSDQVSLKNATTEDIMAYGFAPEFIGRFASVVALDGMGKADLVDILSKPRNSLLNQYKTLFKASGIDLRMPQSALEWVADQAIQNNTGARGLKSILETHLSPILFEQSTDARGRGGEPLKEVVFDPVEKSN